MFKKNFKGILTGIIIGLLFSNLFVFAENATKQINAVYRNIKLVVDGATVEPKDSNGNAVEPFIFNGTTYLPVRAVGEAFDKEVEWDGDTNTVYIGGRVNKPAKEVFLYDKPYLEVGDSNGFKVEGNDKLNTIQLSSPVTSRTILSNDRELHSNYVVYPLNTTATKFKATLTSPIGSGKPELVYKLYGDGQLLYTSPKFTPSTASLPIEVDVSGVIQLKIELEYETELVGAVGMYNYSRGLENARILTTDF